MWRGFLLAIGCAGFVASCGQPGRAPTADERARQERVRTVLHLEGPFELDEYGRYSDGGSLGLVIKDRRGRKFSVGFDQAFGIDGITPAGADSYRVAPRHLWVGATHRSHPGARALAIQGDEEMAVLDLLDLTSVDILGQSGRDRLLAATLDGDRGRIAFFGVFHDSLGEYKWHALDLALMASTRRAMNPEGRVYSNRTHLDARGRP